MPENPLVSICIPVFNGAAFLEASLNSAINQDYKPLEIIISDDSSKDDSLLIAKKFQNKSSIPVRILNHKPNGIGTNWNNSVKAAKGDYIKFLFQDDLLEPNCINKMMTMALKDDSTGLVYSKRRIIFEEDNNTNQRFKEVYGQLHTHWHNLNITEGLLPGTTYLKDRHLMDSPKNKIGEPTATLIKKECFETIGYFNENLHQTLDHEYWYRVMTKYKVGFIDAYLVKFRLHSKQASVLNKQKPKEDHLLFRSYYKHLCPYLHKKNKWKLLKLYHPFFKLLVQLKRLF